MIFLFLYLALEVIIILPFCHYAGVGWYVHVQVQEMVRKSLNFYTKFYDSNDIQYVSLAQSSQPWWPNLTFPVSQTFNSVELKILL